MVQKAEEMYDNQRRFWKWTLWCEGRSAVVDYLLLNLAVSLLG
jgi:hypothetical protein